MSEIANNNIDIQVVETGSENAQYFWHNTVDSGNGEGAGAHVTQIPKADFVADPENGGGNTLITSNGMDIRDGVETRARFSNDTITLYTADGVPAFNISSGSGSGPQVVSKDINQNISLNKGVGVAKSYSDINSVAGGETFDITITVPLHKTTSNTFTKGTASTETYAIKNTPSRPTETLNVTAAYDGATQITWTFTGAVPDSYTGISITVSSLSYTAIVNDATTEVSGNMIWKNPDQVFVVEHYDHSYSTVSSGNSMDWSETKTKAGYWPIGVVGFATNRAALVVDRCRIQDVMLGSCTIQMNARAVASASSSSADMYVLWIKAE